MKVLLVDRSRGFREAEEKCLRLTGVQQIISVESGSDAKQQLQEGQFDVLFLDVDWHNQQSVSELEEIRSSWSELPIILMIQESDRHHIVEAVRAGVTDYLIKPCSPSKMANKVTRWVSGRC
ncbi:MAG: response regulator [Planctomycetaceae bacterium]|nr:response regulator [Planctomycetaceae bacterium]